MSMFDHLRRRPATHAHPAESPEQDKATQDQGMCLAEHRSTPLEAAIVFSAYLLPANVSDPTQGSQQVTLRLNAKDVGAFITNGCGKSLTVLDELSGVFFDLTWKQAPGTKAPAACAHYSARNRW